MENFSRALRAKNINHTNSVSCTRDILVGFVAFVDRVNEEGLGGKQRYNSKYRPKTAKDGGKDKHL